MSRGNLSIGPIRR